MIKKYIQFAIRNGYKNKPYKEDTMTLNEALIDKEFFKDYVKCKSYLLIITSKQFIESIARGFHYLIKEETAEQINPGTLIHKDRIFYTLDKFELINKSKESLYNGIIREITTQQAIHIRENTLDEFIQGLI